MFVGMKDIWYRKDNTTLKITTVQNLSQKYIFYNIDLKEYKSLLMKATNQHIDIYIFIIYIWYI